MEKIYFLQEGGKVSQPYSLDDLRSKNISADTLVCEKFGSWKAAKDIPELAVLLEWQPPMPESDWIPPPPQVQTPNMQQPRQQPQQQYQPPPPQYSQPPNAQQQTIIITGLNRKSTGVAFLLSFFFGPLGLFYASVTGGLVMLVLSFIIGIVTLGIGLVFTWIGSIIWAMVAVNNYNENLNKPPAVFNQPQPPYQQQNQPSQQPTYTQAPQQSVTTPIVPQPPEQPVQERPTSQSANFKQTEPLSWETTPPPDIPDQLKPAVAANGNFISQYKMPLIIGGIVIATGLIGYNLFLKKAPFKTPLEAATPSFPSAHLDSEQDLTGKVGNYPISLHINVNGKYNCAEGASYVGWYYYNSLGKNNGIQLRGYSCGSSFFLDEYEGGRNTGSFIGNIIGNEIRGIWRGSGIQINFFLKKGK